MFFEICGWIGCTLLAVCGVPEAIKAWKEKRTGITWGLILMWYIGEIFVMIYSISLGSYPLLLNYLANIAILTPVLWYKIYPRQKV